MGSDRLPPGALEAFAVFWKLVEEDQRAGRHRSLLEYLNLERFHPFAELIAKEWAYRQAPPSSITGGATTWRHDGPGDAGLVFGHYRTIRELGRGGQGIVYLAADLEVPRSVALKVMTDQTLRSPGALSRFEREAAITARLDHPSICPVLDVGLHGDTPWIAMKYVEGETLSRHIATVRESPPNESGEPSTFILDPKTTEPDLPKHPSQTKSADPRAHPSVRPIEQILLLIETAARALHAAHEQSVIHRDLKPGNMIVTPDGTPVILDFGLAQETDGELPMITVTGDLLGTPAYMSPEQIAAHRIRLDRRTDVYSLGVTLYECLTLKRPFDAPTRDGLYQAILAQEPPDPRKLNRAISRDLLVVLTTAMAKDRNRRYQTALAFAEDLRRVRMHEPILARPAGPLLRLWRWSERNPALAAALLGVFVVLSAGLATTLYYLGLRNEALTGKQAALDEKAAALSDYDQLGALPTLQRLIKEADALWPAEPSKKEAMRSWIDKAIALVGKLPDLESTLTRLRAATNVDAYTDCDRADELARHAVDAVQLAKLQLDRTAMDAEVRAASAPVSKPVSQRSIAELAAKRTQLAALDAKITALDARLHERLTWRFTGETSGADQFKHDALTRIVTDLKAFADPDPNTGVLASVQDRLAFASRVQQDTIERYRDRWATAIAAIQAQPKYKGIHLSPQLGLIPIEADPESGLWEFAHLRTTAPGADPIPKRDASKRLIITADTGLIFVLLPGGTFRMGAAKPDDDQAPTDPNVDPEARDHESPVTDVTLDAFFMSKYEMTQAQWRRLAGANPSNFTTESEGTLVELTNPVEQVSWEDCVGSPGWITRLGLLLPTEAQWEYAARAGTSTPRWTGLRKEALAKSANVADLSVKPPVTSWTYEKWGDGYVVHAPVGSFAPNPFGLHDVLGNVFEWCQDGYDSYALLPDAHDGLRHPLAPRDRVFRGGSFINDASYARSASRSSATPDYRRGPLGVRPARGITAP